MQILFNKQASGVCRAKRWKHWADVISEADFGDADLLQGPEQIGSNSAWGGPRCEWWPAVSTRGLLLLLLRWSSNNPQTGRIDHLAAGSMELLERFLSNVTATLVVAGEPVSTPSADTIAGNRMATFPIVDGTVCLRAAKEQQPADFHYSLRSLRSEDSCSLMALLAAAPLLQHRLNRSFGYLAQFIWLLGPIIENDVMCVGRAFTFSGDWLSKTCLDTDDKIVGRHLRAAHTYSYQKATAWKVGKPWVLGLAVDDGRAGREPWKIGAIVLPHTNFAAWTPCMVPHLTKSNV